MLQMIPSSPFFDMEDHDGGAGLALLDIVNTIDVWEIRSARRGRCLGTHSDQQLNTDEEYQLVVDVDLSCREWWSCTRGRETKSFESNSSSCQARLG